MRTPRKAPGDADSSGEEDEAGPVGLQDAIKGDRSIAWGAKLTKGVGHVSGAWGTEMERGALKWGVGRVSGAWDT